MFLFGFIKYFCTGEKDGNSHVHILPGFYSSLGPVGFGGKECPEWQFLKALLPCRTLELITAKCSTTFVFVNGFKLSTV